MENPEIELCRETTDHFFDKPSVKLELVSDDVDNVTDSPARTDQNNEEQKNDESPGTVEIESRVTCTEHKNMTEELVENIKSQPNEPDMKLSSLRNRVEDKSHLLSNAWNELYSLLGEYKAELFSKEVFTQKYEGITDVTQLKSELVEKDNEVMELREQLEQIQRHNEQCQMDLSVKDSLLKKYQEDLLQKEAALMTSNTKIARLENRLRMVEAKAQTQSMYNDGQPARKVMRTMTPGRVLPSVAARNAAGGVGRFQPGLVHRPAPGLMNRPNPAAALVRRRMPNAPQVQRRQIPSTVSTPAAEQPIVCIEVDDDDEIQEIADAAQSVPQSDNRTLAPSNMDSLYMEAWPDQQDGSLETDTTSVHSLPGSSGDQPYPLTASISTSSDLNQPLMAQSSYSGQDDSMEGAWPVQLSQMGQQTTQSPSNKVDDVTCQFCCRQYSRKENLFRHINDVHLRVKNFICHLCDRAFGQKVSLDGHLLRHTQGMDVPCNVCHKFFIRRSHYDEHVHSAHDGIADSSRKKDSLIH